MAFALLAWALGPASGLAESSPSGWPAWAPSDVNIGEITLSRRGGPLISLNKLRISREGEATALAIERMTSRDARGRLLHLPLWLGGRWHESGRLRGVIADASERIRLNISYDREDDVLAATTGDLRFDDSFTPATLLPPLAGLFEKVRGQLALKTTMDLESHRQGLAIRMQNIVLRSGGLSVDGAHASIAFSSLDPLITDGDNSFGVEELRLGEHHAFLRGAIEADGDTLRLLNFEAITGQGRLRLIETELDFAGQSAGGRLVVDQLDLSRLIEIFGIEGLAAEGAVGGVVPFRATSGPAVMFEDGHLSALAPGILRYRPQTFPPALSGNDPSLLLVRQALENFHFSALRITLNGSSDSDMSVLVELDGANPELYGGQPLEFNLQLDGALAKVIAQALDVYALPDRLAARFFDLLD